MFQLSLIKIAHYWRLSKEHVCFVYGNLIQLIPKHVELSSEPFHPVLCSFGVLLGKTMPYVNDRSRLNLEASVPEEQEIVEEANKNTVTAKISLNKEV